MTIISSPPFSFVECYRFLARSPNELLHQTQDNKIRKLLKINNLNVLFELSEAPQDAIDLLVLNQKSTPEILSVIEKYVIQWLDLNTDLQQFYALAQSDQVLKRLVNQYYGLRLVGINDLFEAICWAIIGQQINLNFAYTLKKRWVETFGESLDYAGNRYYLHPDFACISHDIYKELIKLQFSKQKTTYIIEVALAMQNGAISVEKLRQLSFAEAKNHLCQIKGIGNWTANYVLMKSLRQREALPIEDVGLHNALKNQLNLSQKPTLAEIKTMAQNWQGWEAYATFYLWRSLLDE
ncbi:MAG: DNA-3-methyladenine glycosylase [Microscillaceae bacterium]|nr:DNA-3-methyladenine glycosylase [Microscillaceae bacterium]